MIHNHNYKTTKPHSTPHQHHTTPQQQLKHTTKIYYTHYSQNRDTTIKLIHLQMQYRVYNTQKEISPTTMAPPPSSTSPSSSSSFSSSSSKVSSSSSPHPPLQHCPLFTPIQEGEREEVEDEDEQHSSTPTTVSTDKRVVTPKHHPTPLHQSSNSGKSSTKKRPEPTGDDRGISCNKCRPNAREKISVVPVDNNNSGGGVNKHPPSSIVSPNKIFKSILTTLTRKSPRAAASDTPVRDEQWKIAIAELSHKLVQTTRKRDEALLEASKLKYSMTELEKKLNKLEMYCHTLKSGLEVCTSNNTSPYRMQRKIQQTHQFNFAGETADHENVIQQFLISVSESRSSVRLLSRSLTMQLRQMGGKVHERVSTLLQPHDVKIPMSRNPRSLLFYLEALLNRAFFEDFESIGFTKNAPTQILNPIDRCEANYASFSVLQGLTWEDVLNKGTKHFSEEFSKFCDRKMSEIVAMLGWNRAWPEQLLQAFFGASKNVWLVHLLATSVHPFLPIFRVDNGVRFDSVYMEDMGGDRAKKLVPTVVRVMVAPGFYVYGNVVKCKVLSRYYNTTTTTNNDSTNHGIITSP